MMTSIYHCIYKKSNGKIVSSGYCPAEEVIDWCADDEAYILCDKIYSGAEYIVKNNAIENLPEKPSKYHIFDFDNNVWFDIRTTESQWQEIRNQRNSLLMETDWTDTVSAIDRLGQEVYNSWQAYRQALRDLTTQSDPFDIIWPQKSDFM